MTLFAFWIFIESVASWLSLIILISTSLVFGYLIPSRIDPRIEELESKLNEKKELFDGLRSDYNQFQNLQANALGRRDTIIILGALGDANQLDCPSQDIERREEELRDILWASLVTFSQQLDVSSYEIESWKQIGYSAYEEIKVERLEKWATVIFSTMKEIASLKESINVAKRFERRIILITLLFQALGIYFSFIGSRS